MKGIYIVLFALVAITAAANTVDLTYTVRDFNPVTHPDFQRYGGSQTGLVEDTLDVDGKPVFRSGSVITNAASFAQWFRNVDGINMAFTRQMTLTEDSSRPGVYTFSESSFFPINNVGYGNWNNGPNNFHFTSEIRTQFTYVGGETFSFSGDDDVWVFINGKLAVDIGGVHGPQGGSVNLDARASFLGITTGNVYDFVIFQAERMCCGSTFSLETTLRLASTEVPIPDPGRPAYICEVMFPNFCAGFPQPIPGSDGPARQASCPSDPVLHLGGQAYAMENFNAISFDSFYAPSGDVEGRTAIRNNLNLPQGQYSFGYELRTGGASALDASLPFALVVGRDATWNGGAVLPDGSNFPYVGEREDMFIGGSFTGSDYLLPRITGGPCNGCLDADFDNALAYYTLLQTSFDGVADNIVVTQEYSALKITCGHSAAAYSVHIDGSLLNNIYEWIVDASCNLDAQIVFNIGGTGSVVFHGDNLRGFKNERILYNILGSGRTIQVETEVGGNILGPRQQYNQPGMGVVKGLVIVGNIVRAHQINRVNCVHPAPPVTPHDEVCPEWETTCSGLDFPMAGEVHSFRDFHVISFNSFVANTGDIEGRLAARHDTSLGAGYTIGYELRTANNQPDNSLPYSLITGRDLCWVSGSLHPDGTGIPYVGADEDAFVGGSTCSSTANYLVDEVANSCGPSNEGCLDRYFNAARTCYDGYQSTLAALSDNVRQTVEWSALKLTCSDADADRYVVSLTPEVMDSFTYITVDNCNFQASWVINVRGTGNVNFRGDSFPGVAGGVVYNVLGCDRVMDVVGTAVTGHILAPCNVLHQTGGVIKGKVVVADVTMALQINRVSCPNPGEVTIQVPVSEDAPALSNVVSLAGVALMGGDSVEIGGNMYTVDAAAGKKIFVRPPLAKNVNAGDIVVTKVNGNTGRNPGSDAEPSSSSSSVIAASIAMIFAMLALF